MRISVFCIAEFQSQADDYSQSWMKLIFFSNKLHCPTSKHQRGTDARGPNPEEHVDTKRERQTDTARS